MIQAYIKCVAALALTLARVVDYYVSRKNSEGIAGNILVSGTRCFYFGPEGRFVTLPCISNYSAHDGTYDYGTHRMVPQDIGEYRTRR